MSGGTWRAMVVGSAVAALVAAAAGQQVATEAAGRPEAAFERIKKLAGEWRGQASHGEEKFEATVTYRVTSGGSAVLETLFPGTEHEMVTLYTRDGGDLVLTHYCTLGNQPRMKLTGGGEGKTLAFDFVSGGNMKSANESHMHSMKLMLVDDDHIRAEWTFADPAKPSSVASFDLKRHNKDAPTKNPSSGAK